MWWWLQALTVLAGIVAVGSLAEAGRLGTGPAVGVLVLCVGWIVKLNQDLGEEE